MCRILFDPFPAAAGATKFFSLAATRVSSFSFSLSSLFFFLRQCCCVVLHNLVRACFHRLERENVEAAAVFWFVARRFPLGQSRLSVMARSYRVLRFFSFSPFGFFFPELANVQSPLQWRGRRGLFVLFRPMESGSRTRTSGYVLIGFERVWF